MKTTQLIFGMIIVFILTAGVAAYSGMLTGRWAPFSGLDEGQKLLQSLPLTIETWEAEKDGKLDRDALTQLEIENGYVSRRYRNTRTQAEVNFTMMLGKTGRVAVHTPDICFGGRNYEKEDVRVPVSFPIVDPKEGGPTNDTFWKVNFISKSSQEGTISFFYGISTGDAWEALENPRYDFRRYRYVYKLQAEALVDGENDSLKQFMTDCLPTIHKYMKTCQ